MEFKDYYRILGLSKEASEKDIKDAFKKLAKKLHPDTETGSEEKFKEINEAYEVLKDVNKRSRYDYMYSNFRSAAAASSSNENRSQNYKQKMYSDMSSFNDFYKQKEQELRERQAKDRSTQNKKENSESFKSSQQEASGQESFSDFFEMFFGKQKEKNAEQARNNNQNKTKQETNTSKPVRGEDFEMELELNLEDAYHGCLKKIEIVTGTNVRRLEVSIPPGVRNGTKIKVSSEGKPGRHGGQNGDLYLNVKLKEHDYFWLDEDDVHSEITIEPQEAVLGAIKKIPTLEDIVELVIPPNTYNGRILRLRSKGLKNSKAEALGDHYVHVLIDIPRNLSEEEITTYKYLRELATRRVR